MAKINEKQVSKQATIAGATLGGVAGTAVGAGSGVAIASHLGLCALGGMASCGLLLPIIGAAIGGVTARELVGARIKGAIKPKKTAL